MGLFQLALPQRFYASWKLQNQEDTNKSKNNSNGRSSRLLLKVTTNNRPPLPRILYPTTTATDTSPKKQHKEPATQLHANSHRILEKDVSQLLVREPSKQYKGEQKDLYLGYERWLPVAPKVDRPKTIYNAESLAYIGDCIYELYARRHFLFPPSSVEDFNDKVVAVVRSETQEALLKKLQMDSFLTEEEREIIRWGKNIQSGKTKTIKRVGVSVYKKASSLETLIGYLYLTNVVRLEEVMQKMGFSTSVTNQTVSE